MENELTNSWPVRLATLAASLATVLLLLWATALGGDNATLVRAGLKLVPAGDKLGHITIYGLLSLAIGLFVTRWFPRAWLILGPAMAWFVGFGDELRQKGVRGRDADFDDLLANTVGVLLALSLLQMLAARRDLDRKLYDL